MKRKVIRGFSYILLLFLLLFGAVPAAQAQYETPTTIPAPDPYELIKRVNWLRNGNGYAALVIDPILMGTAQTTAETMAYNKNLWPLRYYSRKIDRRRLWRR